MHNEVLYHSHTKLSLPAPSLKFFRQIVYQNFQFEIFCVPAMVMTTLIVFYVQIMPMTLSCSSTDLKRQRLSQPCVFRLCRSPLRNTDYVQHGGIHRPAIRHPYHHVTAGCSPFVTEYVRNNVFRRPVIRVKASDFSPDVSPLFTMTSARLYARGYRLRPERRKIVRGQRP